MVRLAYLLCNLSNTLQFFSKLHTITFNVYTILYQSFMDITQFVEIIQLIENYIATNMQ